MKKRILIVDAYNMIGNWPQLNRLKQADRLEDARDLLLKILSSYQKQMDMKVLVVFDAMYVPGISKSYRQFNLTIIWTDEGQTAGSYIESLAGKLVSPLTQVTVATSDQAEQWTVFSQGALRKPAWELYQDIREAQRQVHEAAQNYHVQSLVRKSPWNDDQLDKLKELRDQLS